MIKWTRRLIWGAVGVAVGFLFDSVRFRLAAQSNDCIEIQVPLEGSRR